MLAAVTALLAALLSGLAAVGAARAATVDANGWCVLVNRGSGKALDVPGGGTADGVALSQWTRHDGANQRFQFADPPNGYVRLINRNSGKAVVDGPTVTMLVTPSDTTHWINGLQDSEHTVRLVKRNDSPGGTRTFGGFLAAPGGAVLGKPTSRSRP